MRTALLRSTQVRIAFAVQIRTDREAELLTLLFLFLAPVLFLWQVKQSVNRLWDNLVLLVTEMKDLLIFIGKVMVITFSAFAYGLGVKS